MGGGEGVAEPNQPRVPARVAHGGATGVDGVG